MLKVKPENYVVPTQYPTQQLKKELSVNVEAKEVWFNKLPVYSLIRRILCWLILCREKFVFKNILNEKESSVPVSFSCLLLQLLCRHLHKLLDNGVE